MTHRTRIIILCIVLVTGLLLGCGGLDGDQDARNEWQNEVLSRQRGIERPTAEVTE